MKLIEWQEFLENDLSIGDKLTSMTVGIFDGVHRGHQILIKQIVSGEQIPVIVTFRQNHKIDSENTGTIQTFEQKLEMFRKLGVQITIVIDFTDEFKKLPGIEFLKLLLKHGNIGFFAVGSDFKCGHKQDTDAEVIKKFFTGFDIPVEIIPQVMEDSLPISSSRIRNAISEGNLQLAQVMLGHQTFP